jgi:hypothetical protein
MTTDSVAAAAPPFAASACLAARSPPGATPGHALLLSQRGLTPERTASKMDTFGFSVFGRCDPCAALGDEFFRF